MAYELLSRVVHAAGERTGVRARAIAGRGSMIAHPSDLRAARGLPARSPSTPRASLGASPRSPARPCRPRTTLQSGDHDHRHRSLHPNELRSARRLEARPGPAGLAPPTSRAAAHRHRSHNPRRPHTTHQSGRRPPAPQPHSPAGLAPPSSRATMTTGTAATIPADHTPPTSRAAAHRHRRKLAPQVLSGTKLSLLNTSAEATGQNSPCSS